MIGEELIPCHDETMMVTDTVLVDMVTQVSRLMPSNNKNSKGKVSNNQKMSFEQFQFL